MFKQLSLIILLLVSAFANAQSPYSIYINKAEINFIDEDYKSAMHNYETAFKFKNRIFSKDYYNAAMTALKLDKLTETNKFLDKLCQRGFDICSLENNKFFSKFTSSVFYTRICEKFKKQPVRLDSSLLANRALFLEMVEDDQYFRRRHPHDYMNHEFKTVIRLIDSINTQKLVKFIKANGLPNEFNVGLSTLSLLSTPGLVLFQHQQKGSPTRILDFSSSVLDALKKEEVMPHLGCNLYSMSAGGDSLFANDSFFYIEQDDGSFRLATFDSIQNLSQINRNRFAYNLESFDDFKKKILYHVIKKDLIFDFMEGRNILKIDKFVGKYLKGIVYLK